MKKLLYLLTIVYGAQSVAAEPVPLNEQSQEENATADYLYDLGYEFVLTDQGARLKFPQLSELSTPNWADMKFDELVHWVTKFVELYNEPELKLTRMQQSQLWQLEGIFQTRMNQLQLLESTFNYGKIRANRMGLECTSDVEKIQRCQELIKSGIEQVLTEKKNKRPEGIAVDVYEKVDDILTQVRALLQFREETLQPFFQKNAEQFKKAAEEQEKEISAMSELYKRATPLLDRIKKIIQERSKK